MAYPIFSFDPNRNIEIYYIELAPGCQHTAKAHSNGVEEYESCFSNLIDFKRFPTINGVSIYASSYVI